MRAVWFLAAWWGIAFCDACNRDVCQPPRHCKVGMVKDSADCCYVCAAKEGERCNHNNFNSEGLSRCGENMECRMRNDLDRHDPPEAVCVCTQQVPMCGSDGVTYDNICQLTEARYSRRDGLRAMSSEPCIKKPKIRSSPPNIRNETGSYVALTCEASGWPLPDIQWSRGTGIQLQENTTQLLILTRNGPKKDETTSWLLFLNLSKEDEGTYHCKARNYIGVDSESATVSVIS